MSVVVRSWIQALAVVLGLGGLAALALGLVCYLWPTERLLIPYLSSIAIMPTTLVGLLFASFLVRGWRKAVPIVGLLVLMPTLVLLAILPVEIDRVRLPDGRIFMLAHDFVPTDTVFSLWVSTSSGVAFRRVGERWLNYSEDGSWTENPGLVATPEGKHVLVRRGGIWTDCITGDAQPRDRIYSRVR